MQDRIGLVSGLPYSDQQVLYARVARMPPLGSSPLLGTRVISTDGVEPRIGEDADGFLFEFDLADDAGERLSSGLNLVRFVVVLEILKVCFTVRSVRADEFKGFPALALGVPGYFPP